MNQLERESVAAATEDFRSWVATARAMRDAAAHLPVTGNVPLQSAESTLLAVLERAIVDDAKLAADLLSVRWFRGRKSLQPGRDASVRLLALHADIARRGQHTSLLTSLARYQFRVESERQQLQSAVSDLELLYRVALEAASDLDHMPISRGNVIPENDFAELRALIRVFATHRDAYDLLQIDLCSRGDCSSRHDSASYLVSFHTRLIASKGPERIRRIRKFVRAQLHNEQLKVQNVTVRLSAWEARQVAIGDVRTKVAAFIHDRSSAMLRENATLVLGHTTFVLVPLTSSDKQLVAALKFARDQSLSAVDKQTMAAAAQLSDSLLPVLRRGFLPNGDCTRDGRCVEAHTVLPAAVPRVFKLDAGLMQIQISCPSGSVFDPLDLLQESLGLARHLPAQWHSAELLGAALTARAWHGVAAIIDSPTATKRAAAEARSAADSVRSADVVAALTAMDLEALRKASREKIRTAPLAAAGLTTVWDVYTAHELQKLEGLPGLGQLSSHSISQAVQRLFEGVRDETPVRIDVKVRSDLTTRLLVALRTWHSARHYRPTDDEMAVAKSLAKLASTGAKPADVIMFVTGAGDTPTPSVLIIADEALSRASRGDDGDVWQDFLARPVDYFSLLTELGFVTEDEAKMHGDLPDDIVEAVRSKELKREYLTSSLRTYQSFGARFALVQRKVIIGDEMGLGKTVEALAVLAHLRASGNSHFLVVCPAAVVSNWVRETSKHTKLNSYRLHGSFSERTEAAKSWERKGGVAITTYDLMPWFGIRESRTRLSCVIFDEAHYIKNPLTKRSVSAQQTIDAVDHVILMTGTPLENNVQEFRNLLGYVRSDLAENAPEFLASMFRKHVAPAYLRRNQEDVMTELPDLVGVDEWMGMSSADDADYRQAVSDANFMAMRRSAMLTRDSIKLGRLKEIVQEAEANDRRVIVFSYFRDVLTRVSQSLPDAVFGPLTGSTPAQDRQRLVDQFSAARGGAVLVAQITAGGVGLNIQSASVVVICEPQIKPTMEAQAIARAHRMGQVHTVQVHRLLTENSVDERIREILVDKRRIFEEFARESVIAMRAPDAVDVSDAELARLVIAAERERLFGNASRSLSSE